MLSTTARRDLEGSREPLELLLIGALAGVATVLVLWTDGAPRVLAGVLLALVLPGAAALRALPGGYRWSVAERVVVTDAGSRASAASSGVGCTFMISCQWRGLPIAPRVSSRRATLPSGDRQPSRRTKSPSR